VKAPAERVVKDIRRRTRRHFSAEDKIRIVLEGLRYFMPLRFSRMKRFESEEFSADDEFASFDDDIVMMRGRIRKLLTEVSWSENPGSKTRHLVSNVMIDVMPEDTYRVTSQRKSGGHLGRGKARHHSPRQHPVRFRDFEAHHHSGPEHAAGE
jgi:hypothetical protein